MDFQKLVFPISVQAKDIKHSEVKWLGLNIVNKLTKFWETFKSVLYVHYDFSSIYIIQQHIVEEKMKISTIFPATKNGFGKVCQRAQEN